MYDDHPDPLPDPRTIEEWMRALDAIKADLARQERELDHIKRSVFWWMLVSFTGGAVVACVVALLLR